MEHCNSNFYTGDHHQQSSSWLSLRTIACILGLLIHVFVPTVESTECVKRKYTVGFFAVQRNATLKCTMSFQWTVSDFCCYDRYDRNEDWPYCCYSEAYKLALAVGFICLVLLGSSFCLFCCWFYNLPHHLLYIVSCRKFRLDDWLEKSRNGPYVDPSFYSGEPFWAGGDVQPYPLRPMPPRIFYPAPPPNMKFRWEMGQGDMPLFILASRQFHRNPYSARPNNDRSTTSTVSNHHNNSHPVTSTQSSQPLMFSDSRRSSVTTLNGDHREGTAKSSHGRRSSTSGASAPPPFRINIDEATAKSELIEAVRIIEEKSDELEESVREESSGGNNNNSKRDSLSSSSRPSSNTLEISGCGGGSYNSSNSRSATGDNEMNLNYSSRADLDHSYPGPSSSSSSYSQQGNSRGGKVSVEALNQQLSNSLGLSISNLPNVHVIGNFGSGMETIEEDDGAFDETEMDYYPTPPFTPPLGHTSRRSNGTVPPSRAPSAVIGEDPRGSRVPRNSNNSKTNNNINSNTSRSSTAQSERIPRISSALDRIVTRARAEVPFKPSLPGSIPENSTIDPFGTDEDSPEETMRRRLSHMNFDEGDPRFDTQKGLARRNSAPVNF